MEITKKMSGVRFKMTPAEKFRVWSGSEDRNELKACYYIFGVHILSTECKNMKDVRRVIANIKKDVYDNMDMNIFKEKFIFIDTIPVSFNNCDYGYVTGEFTFFIDGIHHKSLIENRMNKLTPIIAKHFESHPKFKFTINRQREYI